MKKLFHKTINFFNGLSNQTLHRINKTAGFHLASFGILGVLGRILTAVKIEGFEWLYNWGVAADVGISIVTSVLCILISFMFYVNDIRLQRGECHKE